MQSCKNQLILHHLPPLKIRIVLRWNFLQWQRNMCARVISRTMILRRVCCSALFSVPATRMCQCTMNRGSNTVCCTQIVQMRACVRIWHTFVKRKAHKALLWAAACAQCNKTLRQRAWCDWHVVCRSRATLIQQAAELHNVALRRFQCKLLQAWTCLRKVQVIAGSMLPTLLPN